MSAILLSLRDERRPRTVACAIDDVGWASEQRSLRGGTAKDRYSILCGYKQRPTTNTELKLVLWDGKIPTQSGFPPRRYARALEYGNTYTAALCRVHIQ